MKIALRCVRVSIVSAAFAVLFSTSALHAATTWSWSYSSNLYAGSGTFTTDSTTTTLGGFTGYGIESATGTWNGSPITLLAPNALGSNDNLLAATAPQLDDNGVSFKTASDLFNVYYTGFGYQAYGFTAPPDNANGQFSAVIVSSTPTPVAATPEPGSAVLLVTGMIGAAGAIRRRLRG